jgi:enamine deaminase RidA (YjgF/YER057c/UK114 family)
MDPYRELAALGLKLPDPAKPVANYVPFYRAGSLLYLSGQGPRDAQGAYAKGKVGASVDVETAYGHARLVGLNLLSVMQMALGDLKRVGHIVKVLGMVNAAPDFTRHPEVINGCSDLLVAVFGDAGRHARSAVGMGSLPNGMTVEIEVIVEVTQ